MQKYRRTQGGSREQVPPWGVRFHLSICSKRFSISLKCFDHQPVRETALGEMVTGKVDSP